MPDVLLFGATGYTGTLTAHALARRGTSFVVAGRDRAKLERLASETGAAGVARVEVGDVDGLARALDDVRALITCVGPFQQLGRTAVEAALEAGVHYVDSSGEVDFVRGLIAERMEEARARGIAMVPASGFDEVPADVAVSLATDGLKRPETILTYAVPSSASTGTIETILQNILKSKSRWIRDGEPVAVGIAERTRWAPMPAPLGPKFSASFPFSEGVLAPLHTPMSSFEIYAVTGRAETALLRAGLPLARVTTRFAPVRSIIGKIATKGAAGPSEATRRKGRWTLLTEARTSEGWRNVAVRGTDVYGLSAETLVAIATKLARAGHEQSGVMSPVQAMGVETLQKELIDFGVDFQTWEG